MTINRAFRFLVYPIASRKQQLAQAFGCARLVYNHRVTQSQQQRDSLSWSCVDGAAALTARKHCNGYEWLSDASIVAQLAKLRLRPGYSRRPR